MVGIMKLIASWCRNFLCKSGTKIVPIRTDKGYDECIILSNRRNTSMNTNNISEQKGTKISEKQCVAGYDKEAFSRFVKSKRKEIINADGKKALPRVSWLT